MGAVSLSGTVETAIRIKSLLLNSPQSGLDREKPRLLEFCPGSFRCTNCVTQVLPSARIHIVDSSWAVCFNSLFVLRSWSFTWHTLSKKPLLHKHVFDGAYGTEFLALLDEATVDQLLIDCKKYLKEGAPLVFSILGVDYYDYLFKMFNVDPPYMDEFVATSEEIIAKSDSPDVIFIPPIDIHVRPGVWYQKKLTSHGFSKVDLMNIFDEDSNTLTYLVSAIA